MSTKEIILAVAEAFNRGDGEAILSYFADSGEWNMLGDKVYSGKEELKKLFASQMEVKITYITMDHVVTEGDTGVIDGYVECTMADSKVIKMFYCDVYELENGKVRKMISYTVEKK